MQKRYILNGHSYAPAAQRQALCFVTSAIFFARAMMVSIGGLPIASGNIVASATYRLSGSDGLWSGSFSAAVSGSIPPGWPAFSVPRNYLFGNNRTMYYGQKKYVFRKSAVNPEQTCIKQNKHE